MKKKIIGIIFFMLMTTTVVSAIKVQEIQRKDSGDILYCNDEIVDDQPISFDWGVDQKQTENCGHGIILTPPWTYAQSFTPAKDKLTAVRLYLFKYGSPPEPVYITVSIRANLTQGNLTTKTIDTKTVSIGIGNKAKWVLFDFEDISVTPGSTYFIVFSGSAGDNANAYCCFYNNEDTYSGGAAWVKPDEYSVWTNYTHGGYNPDDFCFKTFFRKPLDISVPINNGNLINPWFLSIFGRFPHILPIVRHLMEY